MRNIKCLALLFILSGLLFPIHLFAQKKKGGGGRKSNEKVVYKYKEKEVIDFSELSIRGNVITPGDLSIKLKEEKSKKGEFRLRRSFDPEIKKTEYSKK